MQIIFQKKIIRVQSTDPTARVHRHVTGHLSTRPRNPANRLRPGACTYVSETPDPSDPKPTAYLSSSPLELSRSDLWSSSSSQASNESPRKRKRRSGRETRTRERIEASNRSTRRDVFARRVSSRRISQLFHQL